MSTIARKTVSSEAPGLFEARTILSQIKDLNELMFMAGEGTLGISRNAGNAITAGCEVISKLLNEACDIIDAQEGGAK